MKASELRIGNYVNGPYEPTQVNIDILKSIVTCEAMSQKWIYDPIPLTPECLERFGFSENVRDCFVKCGLLIDIKSNYFAYYDGGSRFEAQVKYVHQLQNLYFALTGEELELKEVSHSSKES